MSIEVVKVIKEIRVGKIPDAYFALLPVSCGKPAVYLYFITERSSILRSATVCPAAIHNSVSALP